LGHDLEEESLLIVIDIAVIRVDINNLVHYYTPFVCYNRQNIEKKKRNTVGQFITIEKSESIRRV
jgi:hypothetical protein